MEASPAVFPAGMLPSGSKRVKWLCSLMTSALRMSLVIDVSPCSRMRRVRSSGEACVSTRGRSASSVRARRRRLSVASSASATAGFDSRHLWKTSQLSRAQVVGVVAITSAERGRFSSSAISPKNSPGPNSASGATLSLPFPCRTTRTRPERRM